MELRVRVGREIFEVLVRMNHPGFDWEEEKKLLRTRKSLA
jgi:hypothetical protein